MRNWFCPRFCALTPALCLTNRAHNLMILIGLELKLKLYSMLTAQQINLHAYMLTHLDVTKTRAQLRLFSNTILSHLRHWIAVCCHVDDGTNHCTGLSLNVISSHKSLFKMDEKVWLVFVLNNLSHWSRLRSNRRLKPGRLGIPIPNQCLLGCGPASK